MITALEFEYLRGFLRENAAIILDADKHYLAECRLTPLLPSSGFASVQQLLESARRDAPGSLHRKILDAMTNNETWFFRDLTPFDSLRTGILPELMTKRATERRLTVWSAACSSGQEIYSIAMLIREHFPQLLTWDLKLVATDISSRILERAREGRFSQLEVNRGLPARLLARCFTAKKGEWEINPELRRMVTFRPMNLAADGWSEVSGVDVAFVRNVLIYFDVPVKSRILGQVRRAMRRDGYLILGSAETTLNLDDNFERSQVGNSHWYRQK